MRFALAPTVRFGDFELSGLGVLLLVVVVAMFGDCALDHSARHEAAMLKEARKQTDAQRRAAIAQERQARVLEATMKGFGR